MSTLSFGSRSDIGIVTLWTKKEHVISKVNKDNYGIIGQLYSRDEGISSIIRSCLSNKSIRYLILCGIDLYNGGDALLTLSKNGVDKDNNIIGINASIQKEIPAEAIEKFRRNVSILDCRKLKDYSKLNSIISNLHKFPSYGESEFFPESKPIALDRFPSENAGFKISSKTIGEAWLEILQTIMKFGTRKKTEYGNEMKELVDVMVTVNDENPFNPKLENYFNFTKEELEKYIPTILTEIRLKDVEYTYGERLRAHFGKDQIKEMTGYLKKVPYTRRAVAVTWDVAKDLGNEKAPCLDLIQCLLQENKLYMTVYFRSNDMFDAWPRNAFALRRLQGEMARELSVDVGSLCMLAGSAHIYDSSWNATKKLIDEKLAEQHDQSANMELDPRGNFVISVDKDIIVKHFSPDGKLIEEIKGKTAKEISVQLVKNKGISLVSHAVYVGRELQKAQIALESKTAYEQG